MNFKSKTLVFLFAFTLLFIFTLNAQHRTGLRLGANIADMHGESVIDNKMIVGYNVDVLYNIPFDFLDGKIWEKIEIQGEVDVETKGTTSKFTFIDTLNNENIVDRKQNFTYVSVPVFFKYIFGDKRYTNYYLGLGGYGSSLFGLKIDGEISRDDDGKDITVPRKFRQEYSGFDAGVIVAAGFVKPIGGRKSPWAVTGDVRYTYGFKNIGYYRGRKDIPESQLSDIKTNTISVSVGVTYKIASFSF